MNQKLCAGREETIYLFLDGELKPAERAEFLAHLQQCGTCQALLAQAESLFSQLTALTEVAPPPALPAQVMAKLPRLEESPQRAWLGWLALAVQVAVGVGLVILRWPIAASIFEAHLLRLPWLTLVEIFISLGNGLIDFSLNWSNWLQLQRLQGQAWLGFNLSLGVTMALVVGLGLACLIGNTLLLSHNSHSLKNGGAS